VLFFYYRGGIIEKKTKVFFSELSYNKKTKVFFSELSYNKKTPKGVLYNKQSLKVIDNQFIFLKKTPEIISNIYL
jgi:hypothetical protein